MQTHPQGYQDGRIRKVRGLRGPRGPEPFVPDASTQCPSHSCPGHPSPPRGWGWFPWHCWLCVCTHLPGEPTGQEWTAVSWDAPIICLCPPHYRPRVTSQSGPSLGRVSGSQLPPVHLHRPAAQPWDLETRTHRKPVGESAVRVREGLCAGGRAGSRASGKGLPWAADPARSSHPRHRLLPLMGLGFLSSCGPRLGQ